MITRYWPNDELALFIPQTTLYSSPDQLCGSRMGPQEEGRSL